MNTLQVNPAFKSLIPPLSNEEYEGLEQNILADGKVRDAIVVWNGMIADGHNRYEIAKKHGLSFETMEKEFEDEYAVKLWIIDNQLGRRNITELVKVELVNKKRPLLEAKAKANSIDSGKHFGKGLTKSSNPIEISTVNTRKELAQMAGVSEDTFRKANKILDEAPQGIIDKVRKGDKKINTAYLEIREGIRTCDVCNEEKALSRFSGNNVTICNKCSLKDKVAPIAIAGSPNDSGSEISGSSQSGEDNEPYSPAIKPKEEAADDEESIAFDLSSKVYVDVGGRVVGSNEWIFGNNTTAATLWGNNRISQSGW